MIKFLYKKVNFFAILFFFLSNNFFIMYASSNVEENTVEKKEKTIENVVKSWKEHKKVIFLVDKSITPEIIIEYVILCYIMYSSKTYHDYINTYCTAQDVKNSFSKAEKSNVLKETLSSSVGGISGKGKGFRCSKSIDVMLNIIDQLPLLLAQEDIQKLHNGQLLEKYAAYILYSLIVEERRSPYYKAFLNVLHKYDKDFNIILRSYKAKNKKKLLFNIADFLYSFMDNFFPYFYLHESYEDKDFQKKENLTAKPRLFPVASGIFSFNNILLISCNRFFGVAVDKDPETMAIEKLNSVLLNTTLKLSGINDFEKFLYDENSLKKKMRLWLFYLNNMTDEMSKSIYSIMFKMVCFGVGIYAIQKIYYFNEMMNKANQEYIQAINLGAKQKLSVKLSSADLNTIGALASKALPFVFSLGSSAIKYFI